MRMGHDSFYSPSALTEILTRRCTMTDQADGYGVCSVCGARGTEITTRPVNMGSADAPLEVDPGFEYEHCTACGEDLIPASEMDGLLRKSVALDRTGSGMLGSDEIRGVRLDLGLTQVGFARLLGVGEKTVTRWETGTVVQSRMADRFIRVLASHPELVVDASASVALEGRGPYKRRRE
jgi:putative zinc finger/helix-turn-helix YgiT family protein